jgi:Fic family protein
MSPPKFWTVSPVTELEDCLAALEAFMNEGQSQLPPLIKAGLLHLQFETIHPFLDGNGRVGRLLVTLYLCARGVLRKPLLYLSLYLKTHRADYYRLLQEVRERGTWEAWLDFFLQGVADTANQAFDAATRIVDLFKVDRERITAESDRASSALRVHYVKRNIVKGDLVFTSGSMGQTKWEKDGETFYGVTLAGERLERLCKGPNHGDDKDDEPQERRSAPADDSDIPF